MNRTMRLIFANYEIVIGPSVLIVGGMTLRQMRQAGSAKHMAIMFAFNLIRYRRALGLLSFYYALMHFAVYLFLDQELAIHAVLADVAKRPFIMLGMASLILLIPLSCHIQRAFDPQLGQEVDSIAPADLSHRNLRRSRMMALGVGAS